MTQLTDKDHKAQISGQQQIDLRIQQMELDDQETMTIEEAREMTLRAVNREYINYQENDNYITRKILTQ